MRPTDTLCQRRHVLFTMLTALEWRYAPGPEPPLISALRAWLGGWPGIGRIVARMSRQGHDLQLTRYGAEGWRATFYPAGRAHSQTAAVGSAWDAGAGQGVTGGSRSFGARGPVVAS